METAEVSEYSAEHSEIEREVFGKSNKTRP